MPLPKVTIVIPTYNRAHFLYEAIQSVLNQTYKDFELVIVDDGSTDHTKEVVKNFVDSRIRYIYQENKGISGAMNTGIQAARGEYIARLDSDDRWLSGLLEVEIPLLDADPSVGVVYAKAQAMSSQGEAMSQILGVPGHYPDNIFKSLLYGDFGCAITAIIRKTYLDEVGLFDEALRGNEDWDMWIRLAQVCRFVYVDRVLANFRMHTGRFTSTKSRSFVDVTQGRVLPLDKVFSKSDLPREILEVKPLAYRNAYMDIALRWLAANDRKKGLNYFWKAIQTSGNPLMTFLRIIYLVVLYRFFSKYQWGIRLMEWLSKLRRQYSKVF